MSYSCVVGNCGQPNDQVERCYWAINVGTRATVESHAYLDLCWYHQEVFCSQRRIVEIQGWDKIKEEQ